MKERRLHFAIGHSISHFKILKYLDSGGMGAVYKAEDTRLKRIVALKFLPPEITKDATAKLRFIREARSASALDHPNICSIHEIDETDNGECFIVMSCYEGETLKQRIERESLTIDQAIDIALQIARGLAKAHENGIIHRDIKPGNIMITTDGLVKILDFGLAKLSGQHKFTRTNVLLGTPAYLSPELIQRKAVDHRTDIWSFGVVLYEMMTGTQPFRGEYEEAILYSIVHEEPEPLSTFIPEAPLEVIRLVERMLEKDTDKRYGTIAETIADLNVIAHVTAPRAEGPPEHTPTEHIPEGPFSVKKELAESKKTEMARPRNPSYLKAFFFHLLMGLGLFYVDKNLKRKWLYSAIPLYAYIVIVSGHIFHVDLFKGNFGFFSFMIALACYELSFIDVGIACYLKRRKAERGPAF